MFRLFNFDDAQIPDSTIPSYRHIGSTNVHAPSAQTASGQYVDLLGERTAERTRQIIEWETIYSETNKALFGKGQVLAPVEQRFNAIRSKLGKVGRLWRHSLCAPAGRKRQWIKARLISMPNTPIGDPRQQLVNLNFETLEPYWWAEAPQSVGFSITDLQPVTLSSPHWNNLGDVPTPKVTLTIPAITTHHIFDFGVATFNGSPPHTINWNYFPAFLPSGSRGQAIVVDAWNHSVLSYPGHKNLYQNITYGNNHVATKPHTNPYILKIPPSHTMIPDWHFIFKYISGRGDTQHVNVQFWEAFV